MSESSAQYRDFVSLLTNHQEVIRAYLIGMLPGSPDIRDLLQEVNIFLWEKQKDFKPGSNFGAWACTVAYYKVLEFRKKKAIHNKYMFDPRVADLLYQEKSPSPPESHEAKRNALRHCLGKLSDKQRKLIEARYESGRHDLHELSTMTGRTNASLRVTLHRLRQTLKQCIENQIPEGGTL